MEHRDPKAELSSHPSGCPRGEELAQRQGLEAGRHEKPPHRTARDSTSLRPDAHGPIDPRMPHMPTA